MDREFDEGTVQSAGADIYYKIRGRGFPLIFLHGNGEDHTIFEPHVKYFSRYYLTVQIDSRGHGRSSHGKGTLTIEQMAEDVFAVMDALSIRRAAVIGFSDGANIGMQMAVLDQERLAALIAVGGNAFPGGLRPGVFVPMWMQYQFYRAAAAVSSDYAKKKELYRLMVREPQLSGKKLEKVQIPVLILTGNRDMISVRHSRELHQIFRNSELRIFRGADHFAMFAEQNVKGYVRVCMEYLRRIPGVRQAAPERGGQP